MKPLLCVVFFALSSLWQSLFLLKFCLDKKLGFNTLNFQFQKCASQKKGKSDKKQLPARARDTRYFRGTTTPEERLCDDDDDDDSEDSDPLVVVVVFIFFAEEE
jgi:hypothetical protein